MERLRLGAAPLFFAYRRIRARPVTFAATVAALDYPDEGEVWVGGERVDSLNAEAARFRRRVLGHVSQHSTLVEFLAARENVHDPDLVSAADERLVLAGSNS